MSFPNIVGISPSDLYLCPTPNLHLSLFVSLHIFYPLLSSIFGTGSGILPDLNPSVINNFCVSRANYLPSLSLSPPSGLCLISHDPCHQFTGRIVPTFPPSMPLQLDGELLGTGSYVSLPSFLPPSPVPLPQALLPGAAQAESWWPLCLLCQLPYPTSRLSPSPVDFSLSSLSH